MIKTLKLTNFRQHESRTVNFGAGLSLLRGRNEIGKSSVAEAIGYALFGAKGLRDSLDDVVTWGEPLNSLKVEITLVVEGAEYLVKRGKSGAEVTYAGGAVTGQTEATNFVAKLLRVDAAAAAKLTMASQGEIRGALESGTKATTELIERLAEFSQIDDLVELIQEKLPLGSAVAAQSATVQLEADLAQAQAEAVEPDTVAVDRRLEHLAKEVMWAEKGAAGLDATSQAAQDALEAGRATVAARGRLEANLAAAQRAATRFHADLEAARTEANNRAVFSEAREDLEVEAAQLRGASAMLVQLNRAQPLLAVRHTEGRVALTLQAVEALVAENTRANTDAVVGVSAARGEEAALRVQLSHGTCGFCGQDFSDLPEVAKKNANLLAAIAEAQGRLDEHSAKAKDTAKELERLRGILDLSRAVGSPLPNLVEREDDLLPPNFRWTGPSAEQLANSLARLKEIDSTLENIDAERRREQLAQERLQALTARADEVIVVAVARAVSELKAAPDADVEGLRVEAERLRVASRQAERDVSAAKGALALAKREAEFFQAQYTAAVARADRVKTHIAQRKLEVETLALNNGLLKKVRAARPVIADKLWNIVLSAVSGYFSEIRGERSRVSKDKDGFKVDGHPITSLSGSTKDALGLAIRVALVRTFLPNTPFLLLDEPCAAMDETRTANLLGFVASCGFAQVIAATHDQMSGSFADHVIQLED